MRKVIEPADAKKLYAVITVSNHKAPVAEVLADRYWGIVDELRALGAARTDAYKATDWSRKAAPGEKRVIAVVSRYIWMEIVEK